MLISCRSEHLFCVNGVLSDEGTLNYRYPAPFPRNSPAPFQANVVGLLSIGGHCFVKTGMLFNVDTGVG